MESNKNMIESIFQANGDANKLTVGQKRWLGGQIVHQHTDSGELGRRFHLNQRLLRKYSDKVRKGTAFCSKTGRIGILDERSVDVVNEFVSTHQDMDDETLKNELVEVINNERLQTMMRRQNVNTIQELGEVRRVCRRTLFRYIKKFLSE